MEERELKALEIAAKSKLTRRGKTWLVPSQSVRGAQYTVKGARRHARGHTSRVATYQPRIKPIVFGGLSDIAVVVVLIRLRRHLDGTAAPVKKTQIFRINYGIEGCVCE